MPYHNCPLLNASKDTPEKTALFWETEKISYNELEILTQRFMKRLENEQIKAFDILALSMDANPSMIALIFAALRLNITIAILHPKRSLSQKTNLIQRLKPTFWMDTIDETAIKISSNKSPLDQGILLFTSGSTGTPKIAALSLNQMLLNAKFSIDLHLNDIWLLKLPLNHVGGLSIILRCFLNKAAVSFSEKEKNISIISFVPTQLYRQSPIYPNLRCILLGGAPITFLPQTLPIFATYGLTEMGSMIYLQEKPELSKNLIYFEKPLFHREVKINPDGEVCVKGPCLFHGYLEDGALSLPLQDGWFHTKDIAIMDPNLGLAICGRKDFQFICGGENVQPEEIEFYLQQHPKISLAVVFGVNHPEYGKIPEAILTLKDSSLSYFEMENFLKDFLPLFKIPKKIHIVDSIPQIGEKIDRKKAYAMISS